MEKTNTTFPHEGKKNQTSHQKIESGKMLQSNRLIYRMVNRVCIWSQHIFCEELVTLSQTKSQLIDRKNYYESSIMVNFI